MSPSLLPRRRRVARRNNICAIANTFVRARVLHDVRREVWISVG